MKLRASAGLVFAVLAMLLVFLLAACSGKPSVLSAGYDRVGGKTPSPNAEKAKAQAAITARSWKHEIQSRARRYPEKRFANPSKDALIADLRALAQKNNFDLVSVRLLKPRQHAPNRCPHEALPRPGARHSGNPAPDRPTRSGPSGFSRLEVRRVLL
jgi:hypothetical protein